MRSSSGRDSLARYCRFSPAVHTHASSEAHPRRQGLAAPTSWKRAGKAALPGGARDDHGAVLERLTQRFEDAPGELGQLVEKEDAQVREARLARMRDAAAADQPRPGDRVVGRAERPLAHETGPRGRQAGHAPHRGDLDGLLECERRQDGARGGGRASSCPTPGGPSMRRLWPPAAAISSARLAHAWPRTSARSSPSGSAMAAQPPAVVPVRGDVALAVQVLDGVVERAERDDGDAGDHRGLGARCPRAREGAARRGAGSGARPGARRGPAGYCRRARARRGRPRLERAPA